MRTLRRAFAIACLAAAAGSFVAAPAGAQQELRGSILQLQLRGVVDPFVADYIEDAIGDAEEESAAAVLIT
ncbi:MAG TPA: hypothetical protein VFZ50_07900, partial [Actinomycetota bacterium]|nr:hypothetical protein [Actinomycetota bacterium]